MGQKQKQEYRCLRYLFRVRGVFVCSFLSLFACLLFVCLFWVCVSVVCNSPMLRLASVVCFATVLCFVYVVCVLILCSSVDFVAAAVFCFVGIMFCV